MSSPPHAPRPEPTRRDTTDLTQPDLTQPDNKKKLMQNKKKQMYTFTGNRKTSRVTLQRERVTSVFAIHDKCFIVAVLIWQYLVEDCTKTKSFRHKGHNLSLFVMKDNFKQCKIFSVIYKRDQQSIVCGGRSQLTFHPKYEFLIILFHFQYLISFL